MAIRAVVDNERQPTISDSSGKYVPTGTSTTVHTYHVVIVAYATKKSTNVTEV